MNIVTKIEDWLEIRKTLIDRKIGFVPTMGNLHAGHASLFAKSVNENDMTVASIFVNPTQFNQQQDYEQYPRTLDNDIQLLINTHVDFLFAPTYADLYPDGFQVKVSENALSLALEGEYRPGHFDGMLTVVLKLFNIVHPQRAYFGEKDFQQLMLIKKLVNAFFMPIEIIACETIRASDGLALSSRNSRLNDLQRRLACLFSTLLSSNNSCLVIKENLISAGFRVDYIVEKWGRRLGAVWLGDVRLIDNVRVSVC